MDTVNNQKVTVGSSEINEIINKLINKYKRKSEISMFCVTLKKFNSSLE